MSAPKPPADQFNMAKMVDRLLLRWSIAGVFGLAVLVLFPFLYQTFLILMPASFWVKFTQFYVFTDPQSHVQKVMLGREVNHPPVELKFVWKVRDTVTGSPLCYREITATFEKSEVVSASVDGFLRTCDRSMWAGKRIVLSAHIIQTLSYNIQKETLLVSDPFLYAGDAKGSS